MKRLVLILLFGCLAGVLQGQVLKDVKWKYQSGTGDGYDGSRADSYIWGIFQKDAVCVGEDALFTLQVEGSMLYNYRWYKVGAKSTTLSTASYLLLENCQLSQNGTRYLCEVTDLNTGKTFETLDTFRLNVLAPPVIQLNQTGDMTICRGEEIELSVTPAGDEYRYNWFGEGIVGTTYTNRVKVRPEKDVVYSVTVTNGVCVSQPKQVSIAVRDAEVRLPQDVIYSTNGQISLETSDGTEGKLAWYLDGKKTSEEDIFSATLDPATEYVTVKVSRTNAGCIAWDSCEIINEQAMPRFAGGGNDGFDESERKLSVSGITPLFKEICLGEEVIFACNVGAAGTYSYQWYKAGDGTPDVELKGATNNILIISGSDFDVAGKYYCVVTDYDTKETIQTDPATLTILERPQISILTADTAICAGSEIVLRAARPAADGENYRWTGANITSLPGEQTITVAPTEETTYQLVVQRGVCMATADVTVQVNEVNVQLPGAVDVLAGDTLKLSVPKEDGVNYVWKVDNKTVKGEELTYLPEKNTVVYIEKSMGACGSKDSTYVYIKEYGVGLKQTSVGDGYTESVLGFYIQSVECPTRLCVGDDAQLNIEVVGYDVYEYRWLKRNEDGSTELIDTVKLHQISGVTLDDAGVYYCEVKDMHSGKVLVSDEVTMEVLRRPQAGIVITDPPFGDKESCWVCAGTTVKLQADAGVDYTYRWDGVGILGPTDMREITVLPEQSTDYSLIVSNGVCSDMALVTVNVQDIKVDIPEVKFVTEGEPFEIRPNSEVAEGAELIWSYNNGTAQKGESFKTNGITESGYLQVTMTLDGCEATDSMRIYVRGYSTFQGGSEDGFIESNGSFMIQEVVAPDVVCENADADFSIRVKGSGIYSYRWLKVGKEDQLVSEESQFSVSPCTLEMEGDRYYCSVTDLMLGVTLSSDTVTLHVRKGPKAVISYPERGKAYCIGTTIRIDARETESSKDSPDTEYSYAWEGENIMETERPYVVDVRPTETQVYTLKVSTDGCTSYDTIQINVIDPKIDVPSVVYAEEGQVFSIRAQVSDVSVDAQVNWWHNALFIPNKNPYTLDNLTESANMVAEVVDRGCKATDTARVYVRTQRFFAGGEDDGFMESCNIPVLDTDVPLILGCDGADSVEIIVSVTNGVEVSSYQWQKYNKGKGVFENIVEGSGSSYSGLGTDKLKINPLTEEYYGEYRCIVTNDCGSAYSLTYTVSNGTAPKIVQHIDTTYVCEGQKDFALTVYLDDEKNVKIRWYKKNPQTGVIQQFLPENAFNGVNLSIPTVTPEYDALYLMEVEGVCGTAWDSIRLIVNKKVALKTEPRDTIVCHETPVSFYAYALGGGKCTYVLKRVVPDNSYQAGYRVEKVCKADGSNRYDFESVQMEDAGYYVWTVKSECKDSVSSRMFKLTVEKPLQFVSQTPDTTVCTGTTLALEAIAESPDCPDSKITYVWEKLNEGKLPYATPKINLNIVESSGGSYSVKATNVCGTIELADPIDVSVHPVLVISQQPVWTSAGVCEDGTLELTFEVNNRMIVDSVRWYRKVNAEYIPLYNDGKRVAGADSYHLIIDSLRLEESGAYIARIYNVCGLYETTGVQINVDEKARIVKHINDFFPEDTVCMGDEADLQILATGKETLIYTWYKNDELIADAVGNTAHVVFDEEATYRCVVHNYCAQDASTWKISVRQPDLFQLEADGSTHYCEGSAGVKLRLKGSDPESIYTLYCKQTVDGVADAVMEIKGSDAAFEGGSLDFGMQPAGIYFVRAYDESIGCEGVMPGEVTITMDSLPYAFNTLIETPICEGVETGTVILDSSQYAVSQRYQYILQRQQTDGTWKQYGKVVYGTGKKLTWEGVLAGLYRIEAIDRQTKCTNVMNGVADLSEHPNPVNATLIIAEGDTAYCAADSLEILLKLEEGTFTEGQFYSLVKDGELQEDSEKTDNSGWDISEAGTYFVVVKNEWGCTDTTNEIRIHNYNLPAIKDVKRDRLYCAWDVQEGETTPLTVSSVDEGICYAFFRNKEEKPFAERFKGKETFITMDVPLEDATYYVVAIDTMTGCSVAMNDTVAVLGSRLELSHTPAVMERSEVQTRLELIVKNAIGRYTVKWVPEDQIKDLSDPLHPWVDMTDIEKNVFTATVTDSAGCSKTERIIVSLEGEELAAQIKDASDCTTDIPNDTLWVCKGSTYSLCGVVTGGKAPYGYQWSINGKPLGYEMKLTNAVAEESGDIIFMVGSGGRKAQDTIRLELYPDPIEQLQYYIADACLINGDQIAMQLQQTKEGVVYTLEYSKSGSLFNTTGISAAGDDSGALILELPFEEDNTGFYRVKVSADYDGVTCHSTGEGIKIDLGVYESFLTGGGKYCERNAADTLILDTTEIGVSYQLLYKTDAAAEYQPYAGIATVTGDGDSLILTGNLPDGIYCMTGQRENSACVDTMRGEVTIQHLPKPAPGRLVSEESEYCFAGGEVENVTIGLEGAVPGNSYQLYRQTEEKIERMGDPIIASGEQIAFGSEFKDPGRYFAVVSNGMCTDTAGYVLIRTEEIPEAVLVKQDTGYCEGETEAVIQLKIYPASPDIHYYILNDFSDIEAEITEFRKDTALFAGALLAGSYRVQAKVADCEKELGNFRVTEYQLPETFALLEPRRGCEGTELVMGVSSSQEDIRYRVYRIGGDTDDVLISTAYGDGKELIVGQSAETGEYYLEATDTTTGCMITWGDYVIVNQPKQFDFIATDTVYCKYSEDSGTQLALSGTEDGVIYVLQKYSEETGSFEETGVELLGIGVNTTTYFDGVFSAGRYRVVATTCADAFIGEELTIEGLDLPSENIPVEIVGNACVDSTLSIVLKTTEPGVLYTLWQDNQPILNVLKGDGNSMQWDLSGAKQGIYEIHAERDGVTQGGCNVILERKLNVETLPTIHSLTGDKSICQYTTTTLKLSISEENVQYELYNALTNKKVMDGVASRTGVTFAGVGGGAYYAIASHGDCRKNTPIYTLDTILVPDVEKVDISYTECTEQGNGVIVFNNLQDSLIYYLTRPNGVEETYIKEASGSKEYKNLDVGIYRIRVQDKKTYCFSLTDTLQLNQSVPVQDTLISSFGYCEGEQGARLKLAHSTMNILYTIQSETGEVIESIYGGFGQSFQRYYKAGKYVYIAERQDPYGGCQLIDTFVIHELKRPALTEKLMLDETGALCAGSEYHISVANGQEDMVYVLVRDGMEIDTVQGTGKLSFESVSEAGIYKVIPRAGGVCGNTPLDTLFEIHALPKEIIVEQPCSFCNPLDATEEKGAQLKILNTEIGTAYILQHEGQAVDTLYGDYSQPYQLFDAMPSGEYTILALDTLTTCSTIVGNGIIEMFEEPKRFVCGEDDMRCGVAVEVGIDGSQVGVEYYLHRDGHQVGDVVMGTGTAITFGEQTVPGIYQVLARNEAGCSVYMKDSVIVFQPLVQDTLVVKGSYCEGGDSDITFKLRKTVPYWNYFVLRTQDKLSTDTLPGDKDGMVLIWDRIGEQDIRSGEYVLYALDPCGDEIQMDTVVIDTNKMPEKYPIIEGNYSLCAGDKGTITLKKSQREVIYDVYRTWESQDQLLATIEGTGEQLLLAEITEAGTYTVMGKMSATGCMDTVGQISVQVLPGIEDPAILAMDICLSETGNDDQSLVVELRKKQNQVSYYLQHVTVSDTTVVDSIIYGVTADFNRNTFKEQKKEGVYIVLAKGATCQKEFKAAKIGKPASNQDFITKGEQAVCDGNAIEIGLVSSDKNVDYGVFRIKQDAGNIDTINMNIEATGTGNALIIGELTEAGTYIVKANNGCVSVLKDSLKLTVKEADKIELREEGYTICAENDSVQIEILGRTAPKGIYLLFEPGAVKYSEQIQTEENQASVKFLGYYSKPGYYRIKMVDVSGACPVEDSVEVRLQPMPEVYDFVLRGNKYLCDDVTKKELVVEGAQQGVNYYLYRKDADKGAILVTMISTKPGDDEIVFEINKAGIYYVEASYPLEGAGVEEGEGKCWIRMNGEVELAPAALHIYQLEAVRDRYCELPDVERGEVRLVKSDLNVLYQLYQDGFPYGDPQTPAKAGDTLVWKGLQGGVPKLSAATAEKPINYTVRAIDLTTGCEVTMNGKIGVVGERTIVFNENELADEIPTCVGEALNMSVAAYGGNISYQWHKDGQAIADATNYFYHKDALAVEDIGNYYCTMTNLCGSVSTRTIAVIPDMTVEKPNVGIDTIAVCDLQADEMKTVTLSSRAVNADKWEWYKDDQKIENAIYRWYDAVVSNKTGGGKYICKASNDCGFVYDTCVIVVDSTPRIKPVGEVRRDTLCEGMEYNLSVESNYPVTWYLGVQATSYTGNELTFDAVKATDAGTYYAVAKNFCGEQREEVATLIVDKEITVTSTQDKFYVCRAQGEDPYLFVQTSPSERVYYRWEDMSGKVLGTTNELYHLNLAEYDGLIDTFRVHYGNHCGESYKEMYLITSDMIRFDVPLKDIHVCVEDQLTDTVLRVNILDAKNATYKWYKADRNDVGAQRDSVGNADTLLVNLGTTHNAGYYYCYISNQCVDTVTNMISVRIDTVPVVHKALPSEYTLCSGSELNLSVSASAGNGSINYRWYIKKKKGDVQELSNETLFGLSESLYSCTVDTTYNNALIWCDISTACSNTEADTLHLTVLPAPAILMSPESQLGCEGMTNEIYVKLEKGNTPWKYKYSLNGVENSEERSVTGDTDTLKISQEGVYRVYWLQDAQCTMKGKELASAEYNVLKTSEYTLESSIGGETVCPGTSVTLTIRITGGEPGPWNVGIYRAADGELASELGFTDMVYTLDSIYSCTFNIQKNEEYFARVTNVYSKMECEAKAGNKSVILNVVPRPEITMNDLSAEDRILSACSNIDLQTLFNVQPTDGAWYIVDGEQLAGDWVINPEKERYTVGYRIYQDDCVFDNYNLGSIEFRPRPEIEMQVTNHVLCTESDGSKVTLNASGEYPILLTYRIFDLKKNGQVTLQTTVPDYELTEKQPFVEVRFHYDETLAGKIIEVTRIEDKYKCIAEDLKPYKDTIIFGQRPTFNVYSKYGALSDWALTKDETYYIKRGDSVDVRLDLLTGTPPWRAVFTDAINSNGFAVDDIVGMQKDTAIYKPGMYEIRIEDQSCATSVYDDKPYITVNLIDTAYLKLKLYLQGPWNAEKGKMTSQVLDQIGLRDLSSWPDVGNKKIIDWVEVELWTEEKELWDSRSCLLLDDGTIVDTNGEESLGLIGKTSKQQYHIAVRPRNHLAVWTELTDLSGASKGKEAVIDFTKPSTYKNLGGNISDYVYLDKTGKAFLFGGDANTNQLITSFDPNRITREVLSIDNLSGTGLLILDVNYNGKIEWPGYNVEIGSDSPNDYLDWSIMYKNRTKYTIVPIRDVKW